ncbi:MAG TPA: glycosyltransferase family 39 protein [Oligoflexia bacterium]|nr:glycosyltransferase family 39 protein [Oligoflexia bacterium]HMP26936.1 glycosyltransferase family 39 protein [Oligoflexia bacterium]
MFQTKLLSKIIFIFFLSYFLFCLSFTFSSGVIYKFPVKSLYPNVGGISAQGWTLPIATVSDERIFGFSAEAEFYLDSERKFDQSSLFANNGSSPVLFRNDSIVAVSALDFFDDFKASLGCREGKVSRGGRLIGVKLSAIRVIPRGLFLLKPSFALLPTILLAALLSLPLFFGKDATRIQVPTAVGGSLLAFFLTRAYLPDNLGVLLPLYLAAFLVLIGFLIAQNARQSPSPGEGAFLKPIKNPFGFVCILLILISLLIRLNGVDFGLPFKYHPDESRKIAIALRMVETGQLDPDYFRHPTFLLYATAGVTYLSNAIFDLPLNIETAALSGRVVSVVLGSLSVALLYLIGSFLFGTWAGAIAAVFLSLAPLHVVCSRYIKEDAALLFFILASFYFALLYTKRQKMRDIFLAALFAGFSASAKYSGILSLALVVLALFNSGIPNRQQITTLIKFTPILLLFFVLGFLVFTPYSLINTSRFVKDFLGEKAHMEKGHGTIITAASQAWSYHLKESLFFGSGYGGLCLFFVSLGFFLAKREQKGIIIAGAFALFYLPAEWVKAKPAPQPERYVLPCLPFIYLGVGYFFRELSALSIRARGFFLIAMTFFLSLSLTYSLAHSFAIKKDTRILAADWIIKNVPRGKTIIIDWRFYGPSVREDEYKLIDLKRLGPGRFRKALTEEGLKELAADYFVFSSFISDRYLSKYRQTSDLGDLYRSFFARRQPEVVFEKKLFEYGFHNPKLAIYKVTN